MSKSIKTIEQWNSLAIGTELRESFGSSYMMIIATKTSASEYTGKKYYFADREGPEEIFDVNEDFIKQFNNHFIEVECR